MTQAVARILEEAEHLSLAEREELADCLTERLMKDVPAQVEAAQIAEVRRRIAEVENGKVKLIPGGEVLSRVRELIASARAAN